MTILFRLIDGLALDRPVTIKQPNSVDKQLFALHVLSIVVAILV